MQKRQGPGPVQCKDTSLGQIGCRLRIDYQQGPIRVKRHQQSKIGQCHCGARGGGQGFCLRFKDCGFSRGF